MTSPASNAYKDTYRNPLRYTGQSYRFVPTYLRKRDPIAPQSMSPDVKPPEQQGYYPVNSLWTNTTNKNVWLLRGISNNLGDWVLISNGGGGGGTTFINTDNVLVPSNAGVFYFSSPNITIVGDSGTGAIVFNASPVLNELKFNVTAGVSPISPQNGEINFTSINNTVVTTGSNPNNIDFSVPGAIKTITTDIDKDGNFPGTVTLVNNNFVISGNVAIPGIGTQGIVTRALPLAAPYNTVYLQYADGKAQTVDAIETTVMSIELNDPEGLTISSTFIGFEPATGAVFGGRLVVIATRNGGGAVINSIVENISSGSPSLTGCAVAARTSGNSVQFTVKGQAAKTIRWHVLTPWIASI